jgi:hypothetical protein
MRAWLATTRALRALGVQVPEGQEFDLGRGQLHENNDGGFLDAPWWAWTLPAAGIAGGLMLPAAGTGAGAGATAAGTSVLDASALAGITPVSGGFATQAPGVMGGILPAATSAAGPAAGAGMGFGLIDGLILGGSTIANLFGAKQAADASKDAAEIQAQSARDALAQNERFWNETQQNQAPWLQAGTGAVTSLANLMGVPMLSPAQVAPRTPAATPTAAAPTASLSAMTPTARPAVPTGGSLGDRLRGRMNTPAPAVATRANTTRSPSMDARTSSFAKMQSPDGAETMDVAIADVPHYERLGARRVS